MPDKRCDNCACYASGVCRRFPETVAKNPDDACFEHRFAPPSNELLATDLDLLSFYYPATRKICKASGLKTVADVLAVGRHGILNHRGLPDPRAIQDLTVVFEKLGVCW